MGVLRGIDRRDTFPGRVKSVRSDGERVLLFGPAITTPLQEVCSIRGKPSPPGGAALLPWAFAGLQRPPPICPFSWNDGGGSSLVPIAFRHSGRGPVLSVIAGINIFHELSGMVETARSCTVATGEGLCPSVHRPRGAAACPAIDGRPRRAGCENNWGCRRSQSFEETAGALNGMVSLHVSGNVRPLGIQQRV